LLRRCCEAEVRESVEGFLAGAHAKFAVEGDELLSDGVDRDVELVGDLLSRCGGGQRGCEQLFPASEFDQGNALRKRRGVVPNRVEVVGVECLAGRVEQGTEVGGGQRGEGAQQVRVSVERERLPGEFASARSSAGWPWHR